MAEKDYRTRLHLDSPADLDMTIHNIEEDLPGPDYSKRQKYVDEEIKEFVRVFARLSSAKKNKVARTLFTFLLSQKLEGVELTEDVSEA